MQSKYVSEDKSGKSKKGKSKSKKKDKDSDAEDNDDMATDETPLEPEKIEEIKEHDADILLTLGTNVTSGNIGYTEEDSHSSSSGSANEALQESDVKW